MVGGGSQLSWSHSPRLSFLCCRGNNLLGKMHQSEKVEHGLKLETGCKCAAVLWNRKRHEQPCHMYAPETHYSLLLNPFYELVTGSSLALHTKLLKTRKNMFLFFHCSLFKKTIMRQNTVVQPNITNLSWHDSNECTLSSSWKHKQSVWNYHCKIL